MIWNKEESQSRDCGDELAASKKERTRGRALHSSVLRQVPKHTIH